MNPIKHTINNGDVVLAVDFMRSMMVAGETNRGDSVIHTHYRLRLDDGVWHRDGVRYGYPTAPDIDAREWTSGKHNCAPKSVDITPECRAVLVSRTELKSALERVSKLTDRSLDVDGLLTCRVHSHGLSLVSHGPSKLSVELHSHGTMPAVDSLGTVVVATEVLRGVVKRIADRSYAPNEVAIRVEPRSDNRGLAVHDERAWLAAARPVAVPTEDLADLPPLDVELSDAVVRALGFASTDDCRPNINCVAFHGRGDHTIVEATDGHRLYRERVKSTAFGEKLWTVPQAVLTTLKPKRGHYRITPHEHGVTVVAGGVTVECSLSSHVFPPTDQVIGPALSLNPKASGWESVTWSSEICAEIRKWLKQHNASKVVTALVWQIASEPAGVALRWDYVWSTFGNPTRAPAAASRKDANPFNCERGVLPCYFAEALDAFDKREPIRVLASSGDLDPVYFLSGTRIVCVMPMRL